MQEIIKFGDVYYNTGLYSCNFSKIVSKSSSAVKQWVRKTKGRWFKTEDGLNFWETFLYHETKSHTSSSVIEHWLSSPEVGGSTPKCISKRLEIFRISNFKNLP